MREKLVSLFEEFDRLHGASVLQGLLEKVKPKLVELGMESSAIPFYI